MVDRSRFSAQSKSYMTKDLFAANQGETLTIRDVKENSMVGRDGTSYKKLQLWWVEDRPPLDLNNSMMSYLIGTYGGNDDEWIRKKVFVFHDPTIPGRAGQPAGGLAFDRPKAPPPQTEMEKTKASLAKAGIKDPSDDIPF